MGKAVNGLKLNYKRTALIGFAFFGILLLWQVYDSWCPTFLTDIFARRMYGLSSAQLKNSDSEKILNVQWLVGIIMACDNLAALILLPIFGNLSDKTRTPIGKRMPYILVGTVVSAIAFPFVPLFFHYNNIAGMVIMMAIVLMFMMMYRNPAVALMPDITPKPLRAKANGIINIMGYFGGAFATVLGIFLKLSDYINVEDEARKLWIIEVPFVIASILMVISALVLFATIKENKIEADIKDELELGEKMAAIENPVDDDKPMSKANKRMLWAILAAEFFWFMADNSLGTFLGNYVIYYLNSKSSATMILIIIGGLMSVLGFAIAGSIADKIGRKWTISIGLMITLVGLVLMTVVKPTGNVVGDNGEFSFPVLMYVVGAVRGIGMALVHNCSFPMVVELCSSKKIGRFTGFYYAASMSAQTVTPILLGMVFYKSRIWNVLPVYSAVMITLSCAIFTLFVKNIKAVKVANAKGLEAIGDDD
ncbi:MAG: MFS transporter [Lachnospiraceae bacterium]|nr:MFS transporter [Lachnospiraceae bacterium]